MIKGTLFPWDTNEALIDIQSRLYSEMLLRLYSHARDRYLDACRLIEVDTDLAIRVRSMDYFDHRTLQDVHDLIAAWFRFSQDDGGQLRLDETTEGCQERVGTEWRTFFEKEVSRLGSDDGFARAILIASAFGNTDRGYAAEAYLRETLKKQYCAMEHSRAAATTEF